MSRRRRNQRRTRRLARAANGRFVTRRGRTRRRNGPLTRAQKKLRAAAYSLEMGERMYVRGHPWHGLARPTSWEESTALRRAQVRRAGLTVKRWPEYAHMAPVRRAAAKLRKLRRKNSSRPRSARRKARSLRRKVFRWAGGRSKHTAYGRRGFKRRRRRAGNPLLQIIGAANPHPKGKIPGTTRYGKWPRYTYRPSRFLERYRSSDGRYHRKPRLKKRKRGAANPHPKRSRAWRGKKLGSYFPYLPMTQHPTRAAGYYKRKPGRAPGRKVSLKGAMGFFPPALKRRKRNPHPKRSRAWRGGKRHRLLLKRLSAASGTVRLTGRGEDMNKRPGRDWSFLTYQGQQIIKRRKRTNPPSRGGQRLLGQRNLSLAEARRAPGFEAALRGYRRFHGAAPAQATEVRIADGSSKVTRRSVFMVGEAPAIEYETPKGMRSNKAGKKPGEKIVWRHKFAEKGGRRPVIIHDPSSGTTSLLGGTGRVSSWFYG